MLINAFKLGHHYIWITLLALVLRIVWAIAVPVLPVSDSHAYDVFAKNLVNCNNYGWDCNTPTAYWPVGPSFIYSLIYRLFGYSYLPIILFNLLLAALTIVLSIYLAERYFGKRVATLTGILLALWVSQIQFTTVLASEQMFMLLLLGTWAVWTFESMNIWIRAVLTGIILAGASYVRPTAMLLPLVLMFLRYVSTRQIMENLKAALIMFCMMVVLIAPWSIRNTQAFGQFVTISTNGGANLWMGNNPKSTGGYMDLPPETKDMNEAKRDKYLKSLAISHIKEQPLLFVRRIFSRVIITHSRESIGVAWNEAGLRNRYGEWILLPLTILNQLYWIFMLGLGLLGIGLMVRHQGWVTTIVHPTVLFWGYFAAIHAIVVAQDRYHFQSIPMIAMLAAYALGCFIKQIHKTRI